VVFTDDGRASKCKRGRHLQITARRHSAVSDVKLGCSVYKGCQFMKGPYRDVIFRLPYRSGARVLLVAAVVLAVTIQLSNDSRCTSSYEALDEAIYQVERVVDGDTLLLTNRARIRLIGVDTPETVRPNSRVQPWGPEAAEFTRKFVAKGEVRLQFDRERVDDYDRFLAYVWVGNQMLNEELIRTGLGKAVTRFPYSYSMKKRFLRAQQKAKQAARGLWGKPNKRGQ